MNIGAERRKRMPEKTMYQVFDSEGNICGIISARTIADAVRNVRRSGINFPILVEIPQKKAKRIAWILKQKRQLRENILAFIRVQLEMFEKKTGVAIEALDIQFRKGE